MRMLINQHTLLFEPDAETGGRQIGIIDPDCNVVSVIKTAFNNASFLCEEYYSISPEMNLQVTRISVLNHSKRLLIHHFQVHNYLSPGKPVQICYPPSHLQHMLFELFKNSMRAIIESKKSTSDISDIDVLVAQGTNDVSIKISDQVNSKPKF
jgi:pyruvate dehydrogenase kinase 2/3/4